MEAQIAPLQEEVSTLEQEIVALPTWKTENKIKVAEKQARIDQIMPLLNMYQQIYSNLVVLGKPFDSGSSEDLRLDQLQTTLGLYQDIYVNSLNNLEALRLARLQNTPNIVPIEPAVLPRAAHPSANRDEHRTGGCAGSDAGGGDCLPDRAVG